MNESATLGLLLERGTLTRAELRELTGLSKPTTSDVLRTLSHAGFATVIGHTSGGPGPNAEIYAVNPSAAHVVAITARDVLVTARPAIGAALCNLTGTVLARHEYDVDAGDPVATVKHTVGDLCGRANLETSAVTHVHLSVPGSHDPGTDTIHHIDVAGWAEPGLTARLAAELGTTVCADNDVNLAAIAERHRGVGAGTSGFTLVWFGAGLGCAIDLGSTLLRGVSGSAGELGYVPIGRRAGQDLQELVGGPAVLALAAEHGFAAKTPEAAIAAAVSKLSAEHRFPAKTPEADVSGAVSKPDGREFLAQLAERIALALASVAAILDPPLIVLAGEVAQAGGGLLRDLVATAFHRTTPLRTEVAVTALTDDAALLGALDAGLQTVRESLIDSLRNTVA